MITIYQAINLPAVEKHNWKFTYLEGSELEDSELELCVFPFKADGKTLYFTGDVNEIITIPSV